MILRQTHGRISDRRVARLARARVEIEARNHDRDAADTLARELGRRRTSWVARAAVRAAAGVVGLALFAGTAVVTVAVLWLSQSLVVERGSTLGAAEAPQAARAPREVIEAHAAIRPVSGGIDSQADLKRGDRRNLVRSAGGGAR